MLVALDSSVLVAALNETSELHSECASLLDTGAAVIHAHALVESFATLTGGRLPFRIPPDEAHMLLREDILPYVEPVLLSVEETLAAIAEAKGRGIRGGAIYDFLHLAAAKKSGATELYTLNYSHFAAFRQEGDPGVCLPGN